MVWLWGINLWVFAQSSVSYARVFDLDHSHLMHHEIWKVWNLFSERLCLCHFFPVHPFFMSKPISFDSMNFYEVCDLDDNSSTNEHDSIPVPLLPWRSSSSCVTTCIYIFFLSS
jgi:EXS family